jgi:concanavalin A-like lectin/glucanase superfamily protein
MISKLSRRTFLRNFTLAIGSSLFVPFTFNIAKGQSATLGQIYNRLLNGLVGYWKLDEPTHSTSFADATGNGWTGTNHNQITAVTGIINNGQSADPITVSSSIDTRTSNTPFSLSFWFNDGGAGGNGSAMIGEWGTRNDWVIFASGGETPTFRASDDSGTTSDATGAIPLPCCTLVQANWSHIVIKFDGSFIYIIINNGTVVKTAKTAVRRGGGTLTFLNYQTFSSGWPGNIDEIGYYNRALSSIDITALYNSGNALPFSAFTN